jgi:site-specific recombinase XerD
MKVSEAFREFTSNYIDLRGLDSSTYVNYKDAIESFIKVVGDIDIADITLDHVVQYRKSIETYNKTSTVRTKLSKLKNVLLYTNRRKYTVFPVDEIYLPRLPMPLPNYVTPAEVRSLVEACDNIKHKAILLFLFSSGVRAGELVNLNRSDITENTVRIYNGKNGRSRMVYIDAPTRYYLEEYLRRRTDNKDILFYTMQKGRYSVPAIRHMIIKYSKIAGITRHLTAHQMRHGFATNLVKNGANLRVIQELLGHKYITNTQIYTHLDDEDKRLAYEKCYRSAIDM